MMMTTGEMLRYTKVFNDILNDDVPQFFKDLRLANLMTLLERIYGISMFPELNEKLEREQPWVMQLYRTVSDAREL
jgi:hypothetical protein